MTLKSLLAIVFVAICLVAAYMKRMDRPWRYGKRLGLIGAIFGWTVAIIGFALSVLRPFPNLANGVIERLTAALCPLFVLIFMPNPLHLGLGIVICIIIMANGILYGIAGVFLSAPVALLFKPKHEAFR